MSEPTHPGVVRRPTGRWWSALAGALCAMQVLEPPALGQVVTFAAPHCDPTVNLYDAFHAVRGDTLVGVWAIEGRGRSA